MFPFVDKMSVSDSLLNVSKSFDKDVCFHIVGNGSLKKMMEDRAVKEKLNNVFFHDPVPQEKSIMLYSMADINLITLKLKLLQMIFLYDF